MYFHLYGDIDAEFEAARRAFDSRWHSRLFDPDETRWWRKRGGRSCGTCLMFDRCVYGTSGYRYEHVGICTRHGRLLTWLKRRLGLTKFDTFWCFKWVPDLSKL